MRRLAVITAILALGATAPAAWAKGSSFDSVFADYTKDGRIDPCKHSASELQHARADVPPDIEQYAPDFPDALDAAIEARARGQCSKKSHQAGAPVPAPPAPPASGGASNGAPPAAPAGSTTPAPPPAPSATSAPAGPSDQAIARAAARRHGDSDVPAPLIGLGVLAALALLTAVAYALVRWRAWEPGWALRARHATGEAAYRISATWAEFADWLRLGER